MGWIRNVLMGFAWGALAPWAWAQPAFVKVPPEYKDGPEVFVVPNMPRIRDQGPLGLCQSFSNATLLQHFYCKVEKVKYCSAVDADEEISPIHFWSYLTPSRPGLEAGYKENHRHLNIQDMDAVFKSNKGLLVPINAFINMKNSAQKRGVGLYLCSEEGFDYEKFLDKAGRTPGEIRATLDRLAEIYRKQRDRLLQSERCGDCVRVVVEELSRVWPKPISFEKYSGRVEFALRKESFGEFLFEVLDSQCSDVSMPIPDFVRFPRTGETSSKLEMKAKIIEGIKQGAPVSVGPICVQRSAADGCGKHAIVVSGYKKLCGLDGRCEREAFKVHNSWGEKWQENYTKDGWVDADVLVNAYPEERVENGSIYWLTHWKMPKPN